MTKSTITRERAQQIFLGNGPEPIASEERELARMALSAMDSEPVAIIDQANLDYLLSGADADVWPPEREDMGDVLLYRHPQPAPVVSAELLHTAASAIEDLLTTKDRMGVYVCFDLPFRLRSAANAQPAPVAYSDFESFWSSYIHPLAQDDELKGFAWDIWCAAMLQAGSSPVTPDGSASMLRRWLAFGRGMQNAGSQLPHNLIAETETMLAAAPHDTPALNSIQSVDSVADRWITVSERIPDNTEPVLCIEKRADFGTYGQPFVCWHDGGGWVGKTNYRPIVTHWMPLPAVPQEVK